MEVITKPHAGEQPLKRSPCETILEMDDKELGYNHYTREWDSRVMQDATTMEEHHQEIKDNSANIEPLEGLTKETTTEDTPDKQVGRQWNRCLKEDW